MLVKVKEKGVKLAGKWCYKGDEREIDEEEYEANKEYVDIIKEDGTEPEIPLIPNGENEKNDEETELNELRAKAKELGIRNYYVMKKETLEKLIAEKEAPLFGQENENSDGTDTDVETSEESEDTDTDVGDNDEEIGEDNPQE